MAALAMTMDFVTGLSSRFVTHFPPQYTLGLSFFTLSRYCCDVIKAIVSSLFFIFLT